MHGCFDLTSRDTDVAQSVLVELTQARNGGSAVEMARGRLPQQTWQAE